MANSLTSKPATPARTRVNLMHVVPLADGLFFLTAGLIIIGVVAGFFLK